MEETKCLKPSDNGHESGDRASVQAATRVKAEQPSKRSVCRQSRGRDCGWLGGVRYTGPQGCGQRRGWEPSNRRYPDAIRRSALSIVRERYADFGPTLAAEKLAEVHSLSLSREPLRQWMVAEGLWLDRKARLRPVHQPRPRRDCLGELVQLDGSEHWWFE